MRFGALVKVRLPNGAWAQLDAAEAAKLGVPSDGDSEPQPPVATKGRKRASTR